MRLLAAAMLPAVLLGETSGPCAGARANAAIAAEDEPGQRIVVSGQVFAPDGRTPAAGVIMYLYHTDQRGSYGFRPGVGPRLQAWLRTDETGRYRYTTVRPGVYPSRTEPAHVHYQFWGSGVPAQWAPDLVFDDDPLVSTAVRERSRAAGRFAFVARPEVRDGVMHVRQDFRLKAAGDAFEEVTRHGLRACGETPSR